MSDTPLTEALRDRDLEALAPRDVTKVMNDALDSHEKLERELNEAKTRIEVLEGALRPFVALLQSHHDGMRPEQPIFGINSVTITKQHLINARAVLEGKS